MLRSPFPHSSFISSFVLAISAFSAPVCGEVIWRGDFETGSTAQWLSEPKVGSFRVVQEPVRAGKYALRIDGHLVARGINSIQAIREAGGWRIAGIMVQAESAAAPLPEEYLP
jgi:hypothetical protein